MCRVERGLVVLFCPPFASFLSVIHWSKDVWFRAVLAVWWSPAVHFNPLTATWRVAQAWHFGVTWTCIAFFLSNPSFTCCRVIMATISPCWFGVIQHNSCFDLTTVYILHNSDYNMFHNVVTVINLIITITYVAFAELADHQPWSWCISSTQSVWYNAAGNAYIYLQSLHIHHISHSI